MSLRFQRLILILMTLLILGAALLLILFNTKKNIVFYTPTELLENNISLENKIRNWGLYKKSSLTKKSLNEYEFKITDNKNELLVFYEGILPDLFKKGKVL